MITKDVNREELAKVNSKYSYNNLIEHRLDQFHWIFNLLRKRTLPTVNEITAKNGGAGFGYSTFSFYIRDVYTQTYGFPLITSEVLDELVEYFSGKRVLEVAAGSGYLASLLQEKGIKIKATDNFSWAMGRHKTWGDLFTDVENIDVFDAIEKYTGEYDVILLSWPLYDSPLAHDVLQKCIEKKIPLVYIGEDWGGCTGDDSFFDLIEKECSMHQISDSYIPFEGIHDFIFEIEKEK